MSRSKSPISLMFKVERRTPELVTPAKPTPDEFKPLSDVDNLEQFRIQGICLMFYTHNPSMNGVDPVRIIRKAIAETLVHYYPFAGRLREDHSGKLIVECTGEGVLFIEADADVSLQQFGYPLAPPFPCFDQLIFDVPGSSEILNAPLVLIQVTRLKCGGFIFGLRCNHHMSDAAGQAQFLSAIGEIARGATSPSVLPVWERHVLNHMNLQQLPSTPLPNFHNNVTNMKYDLEHDLCYRAYFFGENDVLALQKSLPSHLQTCSSYEILSACIWKCRTVALEPYPTEEMIFIWPVNLRSKLKIPFGYYGNAIEFLMSTSTAKEIIENPLSYSLELLRKAQYRITAANYTSSLSNLMLSRRSFGASDLRHVGFEKADFGWGEAVYGGPNYCIPAGVFCMPFKTEKEKNGIMLPVCLPTQVMARFEKELNNMLYKSFTTDHSALKSKL